jgi:hypothetical protein
MLSFLKNPIKYFVFIYIIIYIVQRKNVKHFDYKQTAIQSGILMVVLVIANTIIDWYLADVENFDDVHAPVTSIPTVPPSKVALTPTPDMYVDQNKLVVSEFDEQADEFNREFDHTLTKINVPSFDEDCKDPHTPQVSKGQPKPKYEHYNTHSGYTYMDPKTFRVGQQIQPPICLTNQPCETQSSVSDTSLGREFLPYSFIQSNTQLSEDKRVRNKCAIDTVYNA